MLPQNLLFNTLSRVFQLYPRKVQIVSVNPFIIVTFINLFTSSKIFLYLFSVLMTEILGQKKNLSPQTPPSLSKKNTDSETLLSQSAIKRRLYRKTVESSISRRSISRKSSEKSFQSLNVSKFYMKMGSDLLKNETGNRAILRSDILNRGQDQKMKRKRQSTPVPGFISRKRSQEKAQNKSVDIQNELLIVQLQKKLQGMKQKANFYQKRAQNSERELKLKVNKIVELQKKLSIELQKQKLLQIKLKSYEELINKNQVRLTQTKSNLEKLKKSIVQSRYSEIETENIKLRKQNELLKQNNLVLTEKIKKTETQCKDLQGQVAVLKGLSSLSKFLNETTIEQEYQVRIKDEYTFKLENMISKLEVKLYYLNRKKIEELQKLKQKKNEEISKVRDKLTHINSQLKQLKLQNQKLKKKLSLPPQRTSLMSCSSWSTHQEISLSLSP